MTTESAHLVTALELETGNQGLPWQPSDFLLVRIRWWRCRHWPRWQHWASHMTSTWQWGWTRTRPPTSPSSTSTTTTTCFIRVGRSDHPHAPDWGHLSQISFIFFQLEAEEGLHLQVTAEGRGLALFQVGQKNFQLRHLVVNIHVIVSA